jgi:hypothetical protein
VERATFKQHMRNLPNGWVLIRMVAVVGNIVGVATYPAEKSNLDWPACFLITATFSVTVFSWLYVVGKKNGIDLSGPYSLDTPFYPMRRYPLRFWFLASISLLAAGVLRLTIDLLYHRDHAAFGGTFFFWGLGILVVLELGRKLIKARQ